MTLKRPNISEADARDFVDRLYRMLLGREADESGLALFSAKLLLGHSEAEVLRVFLNGDEFRQGPRTACEIFLADRHLREGASTRFPLDYAAPGEAGRSYRRRALAGFLDAYCSGQVVLDVGYSGYDNPENKTAIPGAIGVDLTYPGYDGVTLPFADHSVDTVFSSHCLEHIADDIGALRDWHRVLRLGGFIVCMVPHQALYEKRWSLPSRWNADHKRMYTSASLLQRVEQALEVNSFRLRHLAENDRGFDYARGPEQHSDGAYEIEMVIEKIAKPVWDLE